MLLLLACTDPTPLPLLAWSGDEVMEVEGGTIAAAWDGDSLWTVRAAALWQDGEYVRDIPWQLEDIAVDEGDVLVLESGEDGRLWLNDEGIPDTLATREARMAGGQAIVRHVNGGNTEIIALDDEFGVVVDTGVQPGEDDFLVAGSHLPKRLLGFAWKDGDDMATWPYSGVVEGRPMAFEFWPTGKLALALEGGRLGGDCDLQFEGLLEPFTIEVRREAIAVLAATEDHELVDMEISYASDGCTANTVETVQLDAPVERVTYARGGDEGMLMVELGW
jgi:hypothetical protein